MNRTLARYSDQTPEPDRDAGSGHAQRVAEQLAMADDDDRPDHVDADSDQGDVDGPTPCSDCLGTAAFDDPSAALGISHLPSKPLCRTCILEHK